MNKAIVLCCFVCIIVVSHILCTSTTEETTASHPWDLLIAVQGPVPEPAFDYSINKSVEWISDLDSAFHIAAETKKPLFITMRCLPCKQCSQFDEDVLEGGPALSPLLSGFVTVRLTDMRNVDMRIFPVEGFQDLDLSWWGWFMNSDKQIYGIVGGKDHVSDGTRISIQSLMNTCNRILLHHYDPMREHWNVEAPPPQTEGKPFTPIDLVGWSSWSDKHPMEVTGDGRVGCLHCHQVNDILRQPAIDMNKFDKHKDFDLWPYPENVGIEIVRDHGLLVKKVEENSPAAKAGLMEGDILGAADDRRLFSQADFRGVLHRGPKNQGNIEIHWIRKDSVHSGILELKEGWRQTNLNWRSSVAEADVGANRGFGWPHGISPEHREALGVSVNTMAIKPWFGKNLSGPAYDAGLRPHHVIIAVDGKSPNIYGRAFLIWIKLNYEPGDHVTLICIEENGE
ncbi:MAG: PDZ domain-containing protein, partial [Bacteroidetes bacterium]|nr:PDZ domain-containing protein [Bacteroidota bacterium]